MLTPTKRRLDFMIRRCCGLKASQLMQMWHENHKSERRAIRLFAEWTYAMAVLKLRCCKRLHQQNTMVARQIYCELFSVSDDEVGPCGLLKIPKLKPREEDLEIPDDEVEIDHDYDTSEWY